MISHNFVVIGLTKKMRDEWIKGIIQEIGDTDTTCEYPNVIVKDFDRRWGIIFHDMLGKRKREHERYGIIRLGFKKTWMVSSNNFKGRLCVHVMMQGESSEYIRVKVESFINKTTRRSGLIVDIKEEAVVKLSFAEILLNSNRKSII